MLDIVECSASAHVDIVFDIVECSTSAHVDVVFDIVECSASTHVDIVFDIIECSTSSLADIVFLLDTSGSVGPTDFAMEVSFLCNFVQGFSVGPSAVQFGVLLFSSGVLNQFSLYRYDNRADLVQAIQSLRYRGGETNTASALTFVRENSFLPINGGRPGATQVLIVITDGQSANRANTASEANLLHQNGIKVISIGVGSGVNMEELRAIASNNGLVFTAASFSALEIVKDEIQNTTCTEIGPDEPCGEAALPTVTGRMLNAPIAGLCEWPWMVSVRLGPGNIPAHRCTGVLIGKRKVITTASCASRYTPHSVIVGENNLLLENEALNANNFEVVVKINKTVIHPQHAGNGYDIAVLHLEEDVVFNRCVLPACLPGPRDSSCGDSTLWTCSFAGWGIYSDVTLSLSRRLRETRGKYLNPSVCDAVYSQTRGRSPPGNTVCLVPHNPSQAPCEGDEGGMVRCLVQDKWIFQSLINYPSCTDSFPSLGVDLRDPDILNFIRSNSRIAVRCSMIGALFILALMPVSAIGQVTTECSTSARADIVFLLDTSGSVGPTDFALEVSFVSDFVQGFSVGPSAVQFSVVLFSSSVLNQFSLHRYDNRADLVQAIQSVRYRGGGTNTASALTFVRENSFLPINGGRTGATQVLIVITDGQSANRANTASEANLLHQDGIKVISIGVGSGVNMEELRAIASNNSLVFTAANFSALGIVKDEIQNTTCKEIGVDEPCGEAALPTVTARMLNAPIAGLCEWPWMVSVRLGPGNIPAHRCTGVLIGKRKVITTASCASRYTPHSVIVGENNLLLENEALNADNFEVVVKINKTVIHPQHAGNGYDIAVLHLEEDVVFNRCVLPACLPGPRDSSCGDSTLGTCSFAGWGIYSDVTLSLSRRLRETRGKYLNPTVCDAVYSQTRGRSPPGNTVCLVPHDPSQAPCQGDEGGMVRCLVQDKWIFQSLINYPSCTDSFPSLGVDLRDPDILNFIRSN
ncbi:uncharacterized protein LOC124260317 [Haliotis rubra]|uniref:uncharacterized protein LOC124260317 n=1 Tax=Haliotis rubra TaxID=36100 RepID=UPI001EE5E32C|nr:uncharacterized protein LOC124260317 [Haliotis rubra]